MITLLTLLLLAQSDSITPLLQKGQLVLVEQGTDGRFGSATGIVLINAPPELDVRFVLDVPGPDTDYTIRYTKDEAKKTLTGHWTEGDLRGSKWFWKVEPAEGGKTLLSQQVSVKNFSSILASVEDDQQTMTVGVNVSSALAAGKALKRKCEQLAKQ